MNIWNDFYLLNRYLLSYFLGNGDVLLNRRDKSQNLYLDEKVQAISKQINKYKNLNVNCSS